MSTATALRPHGTRYDMNKLADIQRWFDLTESQFQAWVLATFKDFGWELRFHLANARRNRTGSGFPDLVMAKESRVVFVELKTETGKMSEQQVKWITTLREVARANPGVEAYDWRPSDWRTIEEVANRAA